MFVGRGSFSVMRRLAIEPVATVEGTFAREGFRLVPGGVAGSGLEQHRAIEQLEGVL